MLEASPRDQITNNCFVPRERNSTDAQMMKKNDQGVTIFWTTGRRLPACARSSQSGPQKTERRPNAEGHVTSNKKPTPHHLWPLCPCNPSFLTAPNIQVSTKHTVKCGSVYWPPSETSAVCANMGSLCVDFSRINILSWILSLLLLSTMTLFVPSNNTCAVRVPSSYSFLL